MGKILQKKNTDSNCSEELIPYYLLSILREKYYRSETFEWKLFEKVVKREDKLRGDLSD